MWGDLMLKQAIEKLMQNENLTPEQCIQVIDEMMAGGNPYQIAAFLTLMRAKGETAEELYGIVTAMRKKMIPVDVEEPVLDIVGTGGDQSHSVNISTGSALLAAACGVKIAKHGNRASSSKCGSGDVLEALGIKLEMPPEKIIESIQKIGIGFLFAPHYHPAFKEIILVRKGLGIRTLFNVIGPLLNPARPPFHLLGVAEEKLLDLFADVMLKLEAKRTLIFHGNGMDELTPIGSCEVIEVAEGEKMRFTLDPEKLGFKRCTKKDLEGGSPTLNAKLLLEALGGKKGPISDTLILNAGVAVYVYGLSETIEEGIEKAKKAQKEGKALEILEKWKAF